MSRWMSWLLSITVLALAIGGFWWFFLRDDLNVGNRLAMNHCGMCHDVTSRQSKGKAPPLWGLTTRAPGTYPRYKYSQAFLDYVKANPFQWDRGLLETFLRTPEEVIPGNAMGNNNTGHPSFYRDVNHSRFRKDLVAYIIQLR
ncbi:c-type cytochrome [Magnetococcus sp. PR-3]|uniref:c-type cytochrome n=1 Tax=Magnetococcus sp. PR-3 TaxID=3120355 RepID=UPI002FCE5D09